MKKIFIPLILVILCLSVAPANAQTKFRAFTALTGGGTGAIDKIPIAELANGDIAFTVTSDYFYVHRFDSAATTAESSPTYIRPDDYATAGVWELQGLYGAAVAGIPSTEPTIAFKDIDATDGDENATISVNCTDTGSGSEDCDITFKSQTAGTLATRLTIDADGNVIIDKAQIGDVDGTGAITITGLSATRAMTFPDEAGTVALLAATQSFTNKTFDANATGNVLKGYGYLTMTRPSRIGAAMGAVSTTVTDTHYGMPSFADDAETNNYIDYFIEVPRDIDTTVDLVAWFKFKLGGADTADHDYIISMVSIADSAAQAGTPANPINLSYTADGSGADGDIETAGGDTLTDWKSNVTAGQLWLIRVTRDGDDGTNDASTVDSYPVELTIRYGFTQ